MTTEGRSRNSIVGRLSDLRAIPGKTCSSIAVVPASRTLVVDVPLGKEVLRVGAEVTDKTKLTAAGKAVSLDRLKAGDRVRIEFRRVATGDEAIAVEALRSERD